MACWRSCCWLAERVRAGRRVFSDFNDRGKAVLARVSQPVPDLVDIGGMEYLYSLGSGAIAIHFAALLHDRGVDAMHIGLAASMIGASLFVGNLLAGWLMEPACRRSAWPGCS